MAANKADRGNRADQANQSHFIWQSAHPAGINDTFQYTEVVAISQLPYTTAEPKCKKCGNRHCPRAADVKFQCTRSNDPDQIGVIDQT